MWASADAVNRPPRRCVSGCMDAADFHCHAVDRYDETRGFFGNLLRAVQRRVFHVAAAYVVVMCAAFAQWQLMDHGVEVEGTVVDRRLPDGERTGMRHGLLVRFRHPEDRADREIWFPTEDPTPVGGAVAVLATSNAEGMGNSQLAGDGFGALWFVVVSHAAAGVGVLGVVGYYAWEANQTMLTPQQRAVREYRRRKARVAA